ncbi:MAG: hypothetical protein JJE40_13645 [Vicinamibacteria bacterium]|nr:hypothetical protein [Vicinamibacteria bacterium]
MGRAKHWWIAGVALALLIVGTLGAVVLYRWQVPRVRAQLVSILSEQLGARVDLADLQVLLGREVQVVGRGLVLHHRTAGQGRPPLVRIERITIAVPFLAILRKPIHVNSVTLDRLEIYLPKRRQGQTPDARAPESNREASELHRALHGPSPVVIDALHSIDATLTLESSKPDRPPRTFEIHDLVLTDAAFDRPVRFTARLTNPKPEGLINATGQFGPWAADQPSLSPVSGSYRFEHADLDTIKGIDGTLESVGEFSGALDQIAVKGTSTTPDFSLDIGGIPQALSTTFVALVDGTNGDTFLHDVQALLGSTPIKAKGGILHTPGRKGRTVVLQATIDKGQLPDVLRLALDDKEPIMNGLLSLRTMLNLPPGEQRVVERLELDGEFTIERLMFASDAVQDKVDEFSRRGQGRPKDVTIQNVSSTMRGRYTLKNGVLRFSRLRFGVRGALVQLSGYYVLRGGALDFRGSVRLEARASQTMTGWKSLLARAFDPLLAKDGAGTVLPIRITGTAKQPKFGVEMKKIF